MQTILARANLAAITGLCGSDFTFPSTRANLSIRLFVWAPELWDPRGKAMQNDSRMVQEGFHSHPKCLRWYAVHTRSQHEHCVAQRIHAHGLSTFLPLQIQTHRWSDRLKRVEVPLFSCYVFVHTGMTDEDRRYILYADGVLGLVGVRGQGTPIPDEQIDAVRAILKGNVPFEARNFLKAGQRVRIVGGALTGIEGIFQSRAGEDTLVISVDALQRSLSIRISGYEIKPL